MSKYQVNLENSGGVLKVSVSGVIDEDIDFSTHSIAGQSAIEFHLGNIKSINSCGIREWIKWVSTAAGASISYHECPKLIVDQINMVQGFLPAGARVLSFYVPFYNDDSGSEKNVLFTLGKEYDESGAVNPPSQTDDSGNEMEMDVVEAKYFKFLKK